MNAARAMQWVHVVGCVPLALAGCQTQTLPAPSLVVSLRLLDITTSTPDVAPGADVPVHAIWYDGSPAAPRSVHFLWRLCLEGPDREPRDCLSTTLGTSLGTGAMLDAITVPSSALTLQAGATQATWFVLLAMCPVADPVFDPTVGQFTCPSEASVPAANREGIQAVRTLTVRTDGRLNHDPVIDHVTVGGQAPGSVTVPRCVNGADGTACATVPLVLVAAEGSVETRDDGMPETLLVSFFVTAGSVDQPRAVASDASPLGADGSLHAQWTPPTSPGDVKVWFVLRDGRGGDALAALDVTVE